MSADLYRTRDHVADFDDKVREYARRSAVTRKTIRMSADVAYGPGRDERLDIFYPAGEAHSSPVHIFIHGGYWRMFSKDDFSYVADTVTGAGAIAVVIDYALMPSVRLAEVVRQVRSAKAWVSSNIASHGGDPDRISVSGHSAGAHLATFLFMESETAPPRGALLLSGVYDIRPLQQSFLQPLINLTEEEVRTLSPVDHRFRPGFRAMIAYGEHETSPFHSQASLLARRMADQSIDVSSFQLEEVDHMSGVLDLGSGEKEAGRLLASLILNC